MEKTAQRFLTIRQTAKMGILPEYTLRLMEKQGRLPGVRSGNRFMVNVPILVEQLDQESRSNSKGNGQATEGVG